MLNSDTVSYGPESFVGIPLETIKNYNYKNLNDHLQNNKSILGANSSITNSKKS